MSISALAFNVGNLSTFDPSWNIDRWDQIIEVIRREDADFIILHEMTDQSTDHFSRAFGSSYSTIIPGTCRRRWTVIYSKYHVECSYHTVIDSTNAFSSIRCNISHLDQPCLNVGCITMNPFAEYDLISLKKSIQSKIIPNEPYIISLSLDQFGSNLTPIDGFEDIWTSLGKPMDIFRTINLDIPYADQRGDHFWGRHISPNELRLISTEHAAEHHGLLMLCDIPKRRPTLSKISSIIFEPSASTDANTSQNFIPTVNSSDNCCSVQ